MSWKKLEFWHLVGVLAAALPFVGQPGDNSLLHLAGHSKGVIFDYSSVWRILSVNLYAIQSVTAVMAGLSIFLFNKINSGKTNLAFFLLFISPLAVTSSEYIAVLPFALWAVMRLQGEHPLSPSMGFVLGIGSLVNPSLISFAIVLILAVYFVDDAKDALGVGLKQSLAFMASLIPLVLWIVWLYSSDALVLLFNASAINTMFNKATLIYGLFPAFMVFSAAAMFAVEYFRQEQKFTPATAFKIIFFAYPFIHLIWLCTAKGYPIGVGMLYPFMIVGALYADKIFPFRYAYVLGLLLLCLPVMSAKSDRSKAAALGVRDFAKRYPAAVFVTEHYPGAFAYYGSIRHIAAVPESGDEFYYIAFDAVKSNQGCYYLMHQWRCINPEFSYYNDRIKVFKITGGSL